VANSQISRYRRRPAPPRQHFHSVCITALSDSIRGLSVVEANCDEQKLMNCILCYLFARRLRFGNRLERTPFKRLLGVKRTP